MLMLLHAMPMLLLMLAMLDYHSSRLQGASCVISMRVDSAHSARFSRLFSFFDAMSGIDYCCWRDTLFAYIAMLLRYAFDISIDISPLFICYCC